MELFFQGFCYYETAGRNKLKIMKAIKFKLDTELKMNVSEELHDKILAGIKKIKKGKRSLTSFNELRILFDSDDDNDLKFDLKSDGFIEQYLVEHGYEVSEC